MPMMNEADRLAALRRHGILDTPPEAVFDRIVADVRAVCRTPVALVSLVDADRQWFKARSGVETEETGIETAVCSLTVRNAAFLQIEDLTADPRTAGMALVTGPEHFRFYAGAPLVDRTGAVLGSVCAVDREPRPGGLTADQRAALTMLAGHAATLLEMRSAVAERDRALAGDERLFKAQEAELRYHAIVDSAIDSAIISFDDGGRITSWSRGAERLFGWTEGEALGERAELFFTPEDRAAGVPEEEFAAARVGGRAADERWHLRKDGSRFYAHGAMTPLKGGASSGFVKALRDVTEEHATRSALVASREKVELATRAARLGQFDYFPRTGELEWDDRCRELFGLSPGAPVSYEGSYLAGLHPEDRERGAERVLASLDPHGSRTFDVEYRTIGIEDGVERFIHARGVSLFEGDTPMRLIGTVQDVSEDRRARAKLAETEERLRLAGRATNDAIWDWDLVGDHVVWNAAIQRTYGHRMSEIVPTGAWWLEHIHPDDRDRISHSIHAVIDGADTDWADEYRFRRADGTYADVRDRGYVLRDADGRAVRMVGAMLDQTERKRLERSLQQRATGLAQEVEQRRAEIERLWTASPDLLVVMDAQGRYLRTNPAWKVLLGYEAEELAGLSATDLVVPEDVEATRGVLAEAQREELSSFQNRFRCKSGGFRWLSWAAAPAADEIYAIGRDITEEVAAREALRRTEEALRQSQKVEAIGQLTGGVAHDFNNLLTVIRGSVDLLKRPDLPEERRRRYVDAIADTSDRAMRLTSQLLAFARRSALQPQVFDARDALTSLSPMLRTLTGSRVEVRLELGQVARWISTDPSQFDTAIVNMAANARDAMEGEGVLTIRLGHADALPAIRAHQPVAASYVRVSISDTGGGIAPERLEHIFEPFYTTKAVGQGTGLGLSQVFGFAKQSNGEVIAESEPGRGAVFTLFLPAAEPQRRDEPPGPQLKPFREGACILVVEDNSEVGEFATGALAELGYRTRWEVNADRALEALGEAPHAFDALFTDVVMPGRSGLELAEEVRRLHPTLPIVLTSGYSHVLAEHGSGGFPLLHKPYSIEELSRMLQSVAEGS